MNFQSTASDFLLKSLAEGILPKEEMLEIGYKKECLQIGIPKESDKYEKRVPLTPTSVKLLVNQGNQITIESGAGTHANFQDLDYSEAGASIATSPEQVFKMPIILKVAPPSLKEIDLMGSKQILISSIQITTQPKEFLVKLKKKNITAIAFDYVRDGNRELPIVKAMSQIAGNAAMIIAGELLANCVGGQGMMLGGVPGAPSSNVVILGAGTVGEFATRAAMGLGANITVFDSSTVKLARLQNVVNQRLNTSVIDPSVLEEQLKKADVVIAAIGKTVGRAPILVTKEMVKNMKEGSVIMDLSIDKGGCVETSKITTHEKPTYKKHGVIHYCVPNIPSRVSLTSSYILSNILTSTLSDASNFGGIENMIKTYPGIRNGVYFYQGILTNKYLGEMFNISYKDIKLLLM